MADRSRGGFTLIELLVVVVIIGMLVALLVPAVIAARETARQAKCKNRQRELGLAVQQYETSKRRFPGYVNSFGSNVTPLSWVVMVFADLGRTDLWEKWRSGAAMLDEDGNGVPDGYVAVKQLVCPSDLGWDGEPTRLSYVANCGRVDLSSLPRDQAHNCVFHHQYDHADPWKDIEYVTPVKAQVRLSATDIKDGTQQTLMLSERITAGLWTDVNEAQLGFMWGLAQSEPVLEQLNFIGGDPADPQPNDLAPGPGNPSSNHPGGVIVTFCDGHTDFLNDDIHYRVFQHLMTPDSQKAWIENGSGCNVEGTLSEGDY